MQSIRAVLCLGATLLAAPVDAQPYPARTIKILVGYSAGGAVDIIARTVGQRLSATLGQPVIIDNKPGAGSNIAVRLLIESPPDGYTLMLAANALAANASLYQPAPFDPEKDVAPIALVGRVPVVIAANPSARFASLPALIAAAKAAPGTINFASPGNGATPHLAVELFARAAGIRLQHVPYRGGAQAITDTIGGQVPLVAVNALEVQPHAKAGTLKVLAVMTAERSPILPDVPTIAESGYPGFEAAVWYGFVAPAATPQPILAKLHAEIQTALAAPDVIERVTAVGGQVIPGTTEAFATLIRAERERYGRLIRDANLTPD
jgi:tripartite-type tricarboxylate transporter receptor subunit TctC